MHKRIAMFLLVFFAVCAPITASADETEEQLNPPELEWKDEWQRVRWWQYIAAPVAAGGGLALKTFVPPAEANWTASNPIDDPVSEALVPNTNLWFDRWSDLSDIGFALAFVYRGFENFAVVGGLQNSWDVAWQMFWIDFQALAAVGATLYPTQLVVRRERPYVEGCDDPKQPEGACSPDSLERNRSFFGGHGAIAVASAGTTCVHHAKLDIYPGIGDELACGLSLANATFVSVARIFSGSHHLSDALVGMGVGALAGFGIPLALHYTGSAMIEPYALQVAPFADDEGRAGLLAVGRF